MDLFDTIYQVIDFSDLFVRQNVEYFDSCIAIVEMKGGVFRRTIPLSL
jgi:hypothetical protein